MVYFPQKSVVLILKYYFKIHLQSNDGNNESAAERKEGSSSSYSSKVDDHEETKNIIRDLNNANALPSEKKFQTTVISYTNPNIFYLSIVDLQPNVVRYVIT